MKTSIYCQIARNRAKRLMQHRIKIVSVVVLILVFTFYNGYASIYNNVNIHLKAGTSLNILGDFVSTTNGNLVNEGTIIEIKLKTSPLPHWIPQKIQIQKNSSLLILDDDQSIHDVMNHKLNSIIKH